MRVSTVREPVKPQLKFARALRVGVGTGAAGVAKVVSALGAASPSSLIARTRRWYVVPGASPVSVAPTGNGPAPLAGTVTAAPYAVVGPYSNVTVVGLPRASIDAETLALVVAVAAPAPP